MMRKLKLTVILCENKKTYNFIKTLLKDREEMSVDSQGKGGGGGLGGRGRAWNWGTIHDDYSIGNMGI
jgi:hypothetical protein